VGGQRSLHWRRWNGSGGKEHLPNCSSAGEAAVHSYITMSVRSSESRGPHPTRSACATNAKRPHSARVHAARVHPHMRSNLAHTHGRGCLSDASPCLSNHCSCRQRQHLGEQAVGSHASLACWLQRSLWPWVGGDALLGYAARVRLSATEHGCCSVCSRVPHCALWFDARL
jgi:hypothetical protein